MFKKLGDTILNLIVILERWVSRIQELLTPIIKIGTIISALYSILAIIILFQKKMPPALIQGIRDFPYNQEILTAFVVISFATLILSGGIIEVLRLFGFATEFSFAPRDRDYDSWDDHSLIGGILEIILILLPFVVVSVIVACLPTVFIIVHNIRKHYDM